MVSTAFVYSAVFGVGKLLLRSFVPGLLLLAVAVVTGAFLWRNLSRERVAKLLA
jgi:hypothetical protein